MSYSNLFITAGAIRKSYAVHKENCILFHQLFNEHTPIPVDVDAQPTPIAAMYQEMCEYHSTQMKVLDNMLKQWKQLMDNEIHK